MNLKLIVTNDDGEQLAYASEGGTALNLYEMGNRMVEHVAREFHKKVESGEICSHCENTRLVWNGKFDDVREVPCQECTDPEEAKGEHLIEMKQGN